MTNTRAVWLIGLLHLILTIVSAGCNQTASTARSMTGGTNGRPNVILISVDCLNSREFRSVIERGLAPNFERLEADALSFTRAYAHAPWTTPSHMSMLTGLYPSEHGRNIPYPFVNPILLTPGHEYARHPLHPSLAPWLRAQGYETIAFVGMGSVSARLGFGRGFDRYQETTKNAAQTDLPKTLERLTDWIAGPREKPFFLFLHTFDLHDPMPIVSGDFDGTATISYIDTHLGLLVETLKSYDLYDNALILFTGDHGSHMIHNQYKCCAHGAGHYEENVRVPLLVKLPNSSRHGQQRAIARHIDILPTVADVLDVDVPGYAGQGVSLLRVAANLTATKYSFSEADGRCVQRYGLVGQRYKYIYTPHSPEQFQLTQDSRFQDSLCTRWCTNLPAREELYDLHSDPFEDTNLLASPQSEAHHRTLARFRRVMRRHLNLQPRYRHIVEANAGAAGGPGDNELQGALRSLGYLN